MDTRSFTNSDSLSINLEKEKQNSSESSNTGHDVNKKVSCPLCIA